MSNCRIFIKTVPLYVEKFCILRQNNSTLWSEFAIYNIHQYYEDDLTLRLLMSYIYGAPSKARNANVVYIWTYVWQR